jgi:anti-sigma factor RsiW
MGCEDTRSLLHAYLDDELDVAHTLEVQRHLDACPACARDLSAQRALRGALRNEALYFRPSEEFIAHARATLRTTAATAGRAGSMWPTTGSSWTFRLWLPAGAAAALLAVMAIALYRPSPVAPGPPAEDLLAQEVVASHIRSLMPGHLTDVLSSDQHTVKPWFNGKLDFSPPVKDLADQGYPLAGGRLDYVAGRPIAALVYGRRQHIINLLIWPAPSGTDRSPTVQSRQGYHLLRWTRDGMNYWAVSDLNEDELKEFVGLLGLGQ